MSSTARSTPSVALSTHSLARSTHSVARATRSCDMGQIKSYLRNMSKSTSNNFIPDPTDPTYEFCGQCLDNIDSLTSAVAYCNQCQELLCSTDCLKQHARNRLTKRHSYLLDQELKDFLARDGRWSTILEEEEGEETVPPMQTASLWFEFNIRAATDREICSIHSTVVLPNGNLVLADLKNSNLKLYDVQERKCLSVLNLPSGPRDICLSNKDEHHIYAVETGLQEIHVINAGALLELVSAIPCAAECFGVTCWKRGIAVTMSTYVNSHGEYQLALFDYDGEMRKKYVPKKYAGLEFNLPWYLSSSLDGQRVLISDYGTHTVTCVDVDGGVLFVYAEESLLRPVAMTTGLNDEVFIVGQRSHNIHHVTTGGEKKGVIYSENALEFPGGIAYDKDNDRFYLQGTGWSDMMQVFKFGVVQSRLE